MALRKPKRRPTPSNWASLKPFGIGELTARIRTALRHRVDLGLGHEPADWPDDLVTRWLPDVLAGLPGRSDPHALLAWALGRTPTPPALAPWD